MMDNRTPRKIKKMHTMVRDVEKMEVFNLDLEHAVNNDWKIEGNIVVNEGRIYVLLSKTELVRD